SGFAESIKHGLVADKAFWGKLKNTESLREITWEEIIKTSIDIKHDIVSKDKEDKNMRQVLNFGHTAGHAIESYFLQIGSPILHGEAVAAGMIIEAYLSIGKTGLDSLIADEINRVILGIYGKIKFSSGAIATIINYMKSDKKTVKGITMLSLLSEPGICITGVECTEAEMKNALQYYIS
ncbi:MAG: 3-dehydroquinate synthase, partial [Bacteroidota bacterium]|nr:3-dehydroquinate synthase [Bacteroidota bacterium]